MNAELWNKSEPTRILLQIKPKGNSNQVHNERNLSNGRSFLLYNLFYDCNKNSKSVIKALFVN